MNLTYDNYHSIEANKEYFSNSQWSRWMECPAAMKDELNGLYTMEQTPAMFVSSYYDRALTFPEGFKAYCDLHHDKIYKEAGSKGNKTTEKRAAFVTADAVIEIIKKDAAYTDYMHKFKCQEIITGEIGGVKWRYMADFTMHGASAMVMDLKCMGSFDKVWVDSCRRKLHWVDGWGYIRQLAIGRHLFIQKYGIIPFVGIYGCTKEDIPLLKTFRIDDIERLEREVRTIEDLLPKVMSWKSGEVNPPECGVCPRCRKVSTFLNEEEVISERAFTD